MSNQPFFPEWVGRNTAGRRGMGSPAAPATPLTGATCPEQWSSTTRPTAKPDVGRFCFCPFCKNASFGPHVQPFSAASSLFMEVVWAKTPHFGATCGTSASFWTVHSPLVPPTVEEARLRISANVRRRRLEEGWTQTDLARRAKIGLRTLKRIELASDDGNVTMDTLTRLAEAFGITVEELIAG